MKHTTYDLVLKIAGIMIWNLTTRASVSKAHQIQNFWVLNIDDAQKAHIDQMMSKLHTECSVIRTIQAIILPETLRIVHFHTYIELWVMG